MKRPLVRLNYGSRIDLMAAFVAETTLGVGSQVRDLKGRMWKRMARGDWMTALRAGDHAPSAVPSLVDIVQAHGAVTVVRILGSELA